MIWGKSRSHCSRTTRQESAFVIQYFLERVLKIYKNE
jgi:hypothetical protein